jgi:CubicO group peptidase (beta-lactamase class C family)
MGYQNGQAIPPTDLQVMSPAGGIYSTANDMAKFMSLFFRDNVTAGTCDATAVRCTGCAAYVRRRVRVLCCAACRWRVSGATPQQILDGTTIREILTRRVHSDALSFGENELFYDEFGAPWEVRACRAVWG